uniref:Uncharacterized protein n=1 Tax=Ananas comosus var. bracteatus TaxID=296719 RepID=A0A6V7NU54_ANACO|nr:unnamed protein product [Ananas comosus var. bracteatus]
MPRRQLLLFPLPFQGHINPMFALAALLHSRSGGGDGVDFSITILHTTTHPITSPCIHPTATSSFRDRMSAMLEDAEEEPVACVIADAHWFAVHAAARGLGVPSVALRTGSAASFCSFLAYPLLMQKGYIPVKVEELPPQRVRDLFRMDEGDPGLFAELLAKVVAGVRNSSGLILNAADFMESAEVDKIRRELAHIHVFAIGPLHKFTPHAAQPGQLPPDRTCLAWLDAQPAASVVYRPRFPVVFAPARSVGPAGGRSKLSCRKGSRRRRVAGEGWWSGPAAGGAAAPRGGRVLDALRLELDIRSDLRGGAADLRAAVRGPDGERAVRDARLGHRGGGRGGALGAGENRGGDQGGDGGERGEGDAREGEGVEAEVAVSVSREGSSHAGAERLVDFLKSL